MPKKNKEKKDMLSYREFTKIGNPPKRSLKNALPDEIIPNDDENTDTLEETLIGMEYDLDSDEDYWEEENEEDVEEKAEKMEESLH